jgi:hypothetical protein
MTTKHRPPEASFLTLETLAIRWSCDVDQVRAYGLDGLPLAQLQSADGGIVWGVHRRDVEAFEDQGNARPQRFNPTERRSLLYLVGTMATVWAGKDADYLDHPYRLQKLIELDAVAKKIPMMRSAETNANLIAEGLDLLRAEGFIPAKRAKESDDMQDRMRPLTSDGEPSQIDSVATIGALQPAEAYGGASRQP